MLPNTAFLFLLIIVLALYGLYALLRDWFRWTRRYDATVEFVAVTEYGEKITGVPHADAYARLAATVSENAIDGYFRMRGGVADARFLIFKSERKTAVPAPELSEQA